MNELLVNRILWKLNNQIDSTLEFQGMSVEKRNESGLYPRTCGKGFVRWTSAT